MKPIVKKILLATLPALFFATAAIAQPPPPSDHGEEGNQPAPIGSGIAILLSLGAAYGAKKVYDARKKISE